MTDDDDEMKCYVNQILTLNRIQNESKKYLLFAQEFFLFDLFQFFLFLATCLIEIKRQKPREKKAILINFNFKMQHYRIRFCLRLKLFDYLDCLLIA